ncbi:MAG: hypothetical protein K0S04_789 [Herbinix sp.]|nr:hypothetical protein [Herbinix sp.]
MKLKAILLTVAMLTLLLTGCGSKDNTGNKTTTTPAPTQGAVTTPVATTPPAATNAATTPGVTSGAETPDVVTTASIVDTEDAFLKAISKEGTWIIAITKDLSIDKDLVLEGEYKNGKKDDAGKDVVQRKIALYSQDENRKITAKYVLTAPKLTVSSPNGSIQHGAFNGDLYVDVAGFELVDATIDGDVYFTKKEYKDSFKMDDTSKITGEQKVQ